MVTKGYIQEVISDNLVRLRIPLYHKPSGVNGAVRNDLLPYACLTTSPNIRVNPQIGDIVIIGFEEDDLYRPIVMGFLQSNTVKSLVDIKCDDLTSTGEIKLGKDITINEKITYTNLETLENQTENIALKFSSVDSSIEGINATFDKISQNITDINIDIGDINTTIETQSNTIAKLEATKKVANSNATRIGSLETQIKQLDKIKASISTLSSRVGTTEGDIESLSKRMSTAETTIKGLPTNLSNRLSAVETKLRQLQTSLNNYLNKDSIILGDKSYGSNTNEVTSPKKGQLYFKTEK